MANITLEYDFCDVKAQKTLEYILSLGFFKQGLSKKKNPYQKKGKNLTEN